MSSYRDIQRRVQLELAEIAQITFTNEELFLFAIEGARILQGMIASINPLFVMTGVKKYTKMVDIAPYDEQKWYIDYQNAPKIPLDMSSTSTVIPQLINIQNVDDSGNIPLNFSTFSGGVTPTESYVDPDTGVEYFSEVHFQYEVYLKNFYACYDYLDVNEEGYVAPSNLVTLLSMDTTVNEVNALYDYLSSFDGKLDEGFISNIHLPKDCMFIGNFSVTSGGSTLRLNPTGMDITLYHQTSDGLPMLYCRMGNKLALAPTPDKMYTYTLHYVPVYIPPETEEDDFNIPETFIPFLTEYVVIRAHNRNDRRSLTEQMFLNQKGELIQSLLNKESVYLQVIPTLTNAPYTVDW